MNFYDHSQRTARHVCSSVQSTCEGLTRRRRGDARYNGTGQRSPPTPRHFPRAKALPNEGDVDPTKGGLHSTAAQCYLLDVLPPCCVFPIPPLPHPLPSPLSPWTPFLDSLFSATRFTPFPPPSLWWPLPTDRTSPPTIVCQDLRHFLATATTLESPFVPATATSRERLPLTYVRI